MTGEIRPNANAYLLNRQRERRMLSSFLVAGFDVTWANRRTFSGTSVTVCLLKANESLKETYGFEYEIVLIYSKYSSLEPRTLRTVDHDFSTDPAKGRVEPMWYFLISEAEDTIDWVSSYLAEHKESRIVVPFISADLCDKKIDEWTVRNQLQKHFFLLDRFKYTLPLKEDTYFFGRNTEVNELLDFTKRSENAGVFGLRKTGKTSVLFKLKRLLESDERFCVEIFDAQSPSLRKRSWNQLLQYVIKLTLKRIGKNIDLDFNDLDASDHFTEAIKLFFKNSSFERLTFVFDEIEWITPGTTKNEHWNEEFLEFWQAVRTAQSQIPKFNILVAGVNPALVEDSRFGPYQNPLFGIVTPIFLCGLKNAEVEDLVSKVGKLMGLNFTEDAINYLIEQYAGHPLLTRLACSTVAELAKAENEKFPIKVHKGRLEKQRNLRDGELVFYVRHVVDELERFYPNEYALLEMLALGDYQGFKDSTARNEASTHLYRYGVVSNPEFPYVTYDVLREYVALENARREGRAWKMKLIALEEREKFLKTRMRAIVEDLRSLERVIKINKLPTLFGPNSFPEAEKLFDIKPPDSKDSLGSALSTLNRCFIESIERYGSSTGNKKYFWNIIQPNYQDLHDALHRIKVYRHNSHHLELIPSAEESLRHYLQVDLDDALASSDERYWGLFQRCLDELFRGIQREIAKTED